MPRSRGQAASCLCRPPAPRLATQCVCRPAPHASETQTCRRGAGRGIAAAGGVCAARRVWRTGIFSLSARLFSVSATLVSSTFHQASARLDVRAGRRWGIAGRRVRRIGPDGWAQMGYRGPALGRADRPRAEPAPLRRSRRAADGDATDSTEVCGPLCVALFASRGLVLAAEPPCGAVRQTETAAKPPCGRRRRHRRRARPRRRRQRMRHEACLPLSRRMRQTGAGQEAGRQAGRQGRGTSEAGRGPGSRRGAGRPRAACPSCRQPDAWMP